jgi:NDP-sugar pyrophosphorylase family protein
MDNVTLHPDGRIGRTFVPAEYAPAGQDEYAIRDRQNPPAPGRWRELTSAERELLILNGNTAEDWDEVLVTDVFDPKMIRNSSFHGLVRIGAVRPAVLEHHDLKVPVGINNCFVTECDIGDDCALFNVHYLAHYIIGDRCIIANVDEMHVTNHAKFGNGIVKDGEPEEVRVWLDVMNETGSRQVMPFDGMITADAYLWAKYRDDEKLVERLGTITQQRFDSARGYYGTVGAQSVVKTSRILKDVKVGAHCYIKGANKLKNLTINSSADEPSQIGEGVELVNGIIGYGCHIFYGCKAVRFILGNNSNLKYGARLINSFLGDNSTISCCEVLNNLIFPAHEQHHNNSFLIASVVKGQSNLAAGATVGSNHNSRANDNEIEAGRGFWPGLCTSLKHSSVFASYVLVAKGAYPAEMNIPFPFALVNNNERDGHLEIMPAFWWLYNMYALARNSWKFGNRDKRTTKTQHIEFDYLAPDTVEEIIRARDLLALWTAEAEAARADSGHDAGGDACRVTPLARVHRTDADQRALIERGHELLSSADGLPAGLRVFGEGLEKSRRPVEIVKPARAYRAYGDMLAYYGVRNTIAHMDSHPEAGQDAVLSGETGLGGSRVTDWTNLGGQLMRTADVDALREDIGSGTLDSWEEIHRRYDELWASYPGEKQRHAYAVLCEIVGTEKLERDQWLELLSRARRVQEYIRDQVHRSRQKDFENPFRRATYRSVAEMTAAIGTIDDNSFVQQVRDETERFLETVDERLS